MKTRLSVSCVVFSLLAAASLLLGSVTAFPASDEDVFRFRAYPNMLIVLNRSASMATPLDNSALDLDGDHRFTRYDLALKSLFRVLNADGERHPSYGTSSPDSTAAVPEFRALITVEDELYLGQRTGVLWFDNTARRAYTAPYQVLSPPTTPNQPPYAAWSYVGIWDNVYALNGTSPLPASGATVSFPKNDIVDYFSYATSNPAPDVSAPCRPKVVLLVTDGSDVADATLNDILLDSTYNLYILGIGVTNVGTRNKLRRLITRMTDSAIDATQDEAGAEGRIAFFYTANDVETSAIFQNMVAQLQSSTFEFVAPVVPAVRTSDANRLFVASFTPATGSGISNSLWPGHLRSFDLNDDGSIPDPLVQNWDAATRLRDMPASAREIYSYLEGTRKYFLLDPISGVTPASLGVSSDAEAAAVINTVRGLGLGDIFHSTPVFVGSPSPYYADLGGLEARIEFVNNHAHRKRIVVAGANDGTIHAFHAGVWDAGATPPGYTAGNGGEEWAYLPGFLLGKVKNFYQLPTTHFYYVDSPPAVADIWIDSNSDKVDAHKASEWHTYLIGGAGRGGKGYFGLDITDPDDPKPQWELTKSQTAYLGETWSTPALGKVRKIVVIDYQLYGYDQWVAVVGAGKGGSIGSTTLTAPADLSAISNPYTIRVASTEDAPDSGTVTLTVTLYERKGSRWVYSTYTATGSYTSRTDNSFDNVVFLNTSDKLNYPAATTTVSWTDPGNEGKAILVLDAGSGQILQTLTHPSMGQVVAPPTVVNDASGYIERLYVGDLNGNLWRVAVDNTGVASLGGAPFFSITGATYSKKIYTKASLARGAGSYPYWWIYFGTGDQTNPMGGTKGAVFGVFDSDVFSRRGMITTTKTESNLANATSFFAGITEASISFPTLGPDDKGWFGELPVVAEKMLSHPKVFNSNLFFTTFEPSAGDCSVGGTGRVYGLGIVPGYNAGNYALFASSSSTTADTRVLTMSSVGIPSSPVVSVGSSGAAMMYLGTTGSSVRALAIPTPITNKSIRYWKEVF